MMKPRNNPLSQSPLASADKNKTPMTDEEKLQEKANRDEFRKRHELYAQAYEKRMGIKRSQFELKLSFDEIEQAEKDKIALENATGAPSLVATNGSNEWFKPGFWRFNDKIDLLYDENESIRPIPFNHDVKFNKEGYSAAFDFLVVKQFATTITLDLPSPTDGRLRDFNKKQLNGMMKLALDKGVSVEFSDNTKQYLATLSEKERQRFIDRRDVLIRNQKRNEVFMMDENTKKTDMESGAKAIDKAVKKEKFDPADPAAYKKKTYEDHGVDLDPLKDKDKDNIDKKIETIEKKMEDISKRRESLERTTKELNDDLNIMNEIATKPNLLARAKFDKKSSWTHDMAKKLGFYDVDKIKQKYEDKENVIKKLEDLNTPEHKASRDKLIKAINTEQAQLQKLSEEWNKDLTALKTRLQDTTQTPMR